MRSRTPSKAAIAIPLAPFSITDLNTYEKETTSIETEFENLNVNLKLNEKKHLNEIINDSKKLKDICDRINALNKKFNTGKKDVKETTVISTAKEIIGLIKLSIGHQKVQKASTEGLSTPSSKHPVETTQSTTPTEATSTTSGKKKKQQKKASKPGGVGTS
jgi:hypothetical protein